MASNNLAHATRKSMAMGPSVRNLLSHYQLDPSKIASTGPHQTLLKGDVLSYIDQNGLNPAQQTSTIRADSSAHDVNRKAAKVFVSNLDTSGYQPKPGPDGFSKIAKRLLDM